MEVVNIEMKPEPEKFDRAFWEGLHATLADTRLPVTAPQRVLALQQAHSGATDALEVLRRGPLSARHDIKLMDHVLQKAMCQRNATQPAHARLMQAVWRALRMPDKLSQQQQKAHAMAQRSNVRWCTEDDRFLQLMIFIVERMKIPDAQGQPSILTLIPEDQAFFNRYLQKLHKRVRLIPIYRDRQGEASEVVLQLLRIKRGLGDKCAPEKLTQLLDKATILRAGGPAAADCPPFSVEDFGMLAMFDRALHRLCVLSDAKLLPEEYTTSLRMLKQLHAFSNEAVAEIGAGSQSRPGDIEFDDYSLEFRSHHASMGWVDHGMMAVTCSGFAHTGVALMDARRAEMTTDGFTTRKVPLGKMIASTAYRLDWQRVVTPAGQDAIQEAWGPTWATTLQQVFENRVTTLMGAPELQETSFDRTAFLSPLRLHWQRQPEDLRSLPNKPMFCSELAARTLAVTLHGLEADLQAASDRPDKPMFQRIFSQYEDFTAVHPGYLHRRLQPYVQTVPRAPALHKYMGAHAPEHYLGHIARFAQEKAAVLQPWRRG